MSAATNDRRALYLLSSLVLMILLSPFLGTHRLGEVILVISLFVALITAILELHGKRTFRWLAIAVAVPVVLTEFAGFFYSSHALMILDYALLMAFFGFASVGLFTYLGKPGAITRIYASVSLYLMLAMFWFALYNLTESIYPESFAQAGALSSARVPRPAFLYFSLITLTTVGYGDVVPVTPAARVFAALEGVAGVMYVAITVARLVAAYQSAERNQQ
jgi:voltage-gated potassium channel Kch